MSEETPRPDAVAPETQPSPSLPPAAPSQQLVPPPAYPPSYPAWQPAAAPAPAKRPGFGHGLGLGAGAGIGFGAVLTVGLLVSAVVFGLLAAAGGAASTGSSLETIWGKPTAANTIRAVSVTGTILGAASDGSTLTGGTYGYEIAAGIDELGAEDAAGLLLVMNTPGGTINGSKAIADAVTRYQERTGHKVVAFVQGMSASGGMYAMAGADEIIADHGSLIGSIGVIYGPITRYHDVTATTGTILESGVVTSGGITEEYLTAGRGKDFGNPYRDMTEEERTVFNGILQNLYGDFVGWVSEARGIPSQTIVDELGAHIFDPKAAVANGLIDSELGIMDAYARAAEVMGVDPSDTRIVTPAPPTLVEQLLGAEARIPGQALPAAVEPGARAASAVCNPTPTALVFHGDVAAICG